MTKCQCTMELYASVNSVKFNLWLHCTSKSPLRWRLISATREGSHPLSFMAGLFPAN